VIPHETGKAFQRLFDVFVAGGIAGANEPGTAGTEGAARHKRDALLPQQALTERLVVHARDGNGRESIERAAWLKTRHAEFVETLDDPAAAAIILLAHIE